MFKKWTTDNIRNRSNIKTAISTKLKATAAKQIPRFNEIVDELFPKKAPVIVHHLGDKSSIYSVNGNPVLIELGNGTLMPTLRVAQEYQGLLRCVYVHPQAIAAVLRGSGLMARGAWGIDETYKKGEVVQLCMLEQTIPFAVGIMQMSGEEVLQRPSGPAVIAMNLLRDGLWMCKSL